MVQNYIFPLSLGECRTKIIISQTRSSGAGSSCFKRGVWRLSCALLHAVHVWWWWLHLQVLLLGRAASTQATCLSSQIFDFRANGSGSSAKGKSYCWQKNWGNKGVLPCLHKLLVCEIHDGGWALFESHWQHSVIWSDTFLSYGFLVITVIFSFIYPSMMRCE